jgi:beta-lactamase regulating signal transducer with metallopeptidase domain
VAGAGILLDGGVMPAFILLVKAGLILGFAWTLAHAARRSSAAVRHAIWAVALLSVVVLPPLAPALPPLTVRVPASLAPSPPATPTARARPVTAPRATAGVSAVERSMASGAAAVDRGRAEGTVAGAGVDAGTMLVLLWLLGVTTRALWLVAQVVRVRRLTGSAAPVETEWRAAAAALVAKSMRVRRRVRLLESDRIATPLTCGILRPAILLPRESIDWSEDRLRVVLLHELAHVRRWDYVACLLAEIACALYWPLPLVWVARAGLHSEQEQASDDLVLAAGTAPVDYADHLLAIARALHGEARPISGTIGMAREVGLKRRIRTILDGGTARVPLRSWQGAATVCVVAALALPVTALRPAGAAPPAAAARPDTAAPSSPAPTLAPAPPSAEESPVPHAYLWLEAEHGLLRDGAELREALDASLGHYVVAGEGSAPGETALSLHLQRAGEYFVWARVSGGGGEGPFVSVDGDPSLRAELNPRLDPADEGWSWRRGGGSDPAPLLLAAGVHTLRIHGGGGAGVDRLLVTTDSDFVPAGRGDAAAVAAEHRWLDVAPGVLAGPTELEFEVRGDGPYVLWGRVLGLNAEANSFHLSVDDGPEVVWDAPMRDLGQDENRWVWDPASARELDGRPVDPLILDLAPGRHTVRLRPREPGTGLGGLLVTNDLSFRPRGAPPGAPTVRVWLEPETAPPVEALRVRAGAGAMGDGYIEATGRGSDRSPPGEAGAASLAFVLPHSGVYTLWARTVARSDGEDSFWIRVNDGDWVRWNGIPRSREWRWSSVHAGDGPDAPLQLALPAGENRIEIARREGGARLDRMLVTNDDFFEPRGTGAE